MENETDPLAPVHDALTAIDGVHRRISAADLVSNGEFETPPRPAASQTLASLGSRAIIDDVVHGMYRSTNQLITEVAMGSAEHALAQLTAASMASGSMAAETSWVSAENVVASLYQDAASTAIASYGGDFVPTATDTISATSGAALAAAVSRIMDVGPAAIRVSQMESLAIDGALFDAAGYAADELAIAGRWELGSLWSDDRDHVSHLLGSAAWSAVDPFGPGTWLPDATSFAPIPPSLYETYRPEPGSLYADLFLLGESNVDPEEQAAAMHRMADRIPWYPRKASVQRALAEQANVEETSIEAIRHRELCAAVVLVFGDKRRATAHRFGQEWVTDDNGHKVAVSPTDLPMEYFWAWLWREVRKAAEASVLGRPYPPTTGDAMDRTKEGVWLCRSLEAAQPEPVDSESDPLVMLLETERQAQNDIRLLAALQVATPKQRAILKLLASGLSEAEAARRLGMAPATARAQMHRLRHKIM